MVRAGTWPLYAGAPIRTRLRTKSARVLCIRNVRFLLGLLVALGYDALPGISISLDMVACEAVTRAALEVWERREARAGRRYQVRHQRPRCTHCFNSWR